MACWHLSLAAADEISPSLDKNFVWRASYGFAPSVADPHRKNADADPGKNLNADADADPVADADSYPY